MAKPPARLVPRKRTRSPQCPAISVLLGTTTGRLAPEQAPPTHKMIDEPPCRGAAAQVRSSETFLCACEASTEKLPAERLILILEPGKRLIKMAWLEIGPVFIENVEIRINRLHWQKPTQTACATPAHDQIQTRNFI